MAKNPRRWKLLEQRRGGRSYFVLQSNSPFKATITLGYVQKDQADRAVEYLRAEEEKTAGTRAEGRYLRYYQEDRKGAVEALVMADFSRLCRDGDDAGPDLRNITLRDFALAIWWPVRQQETAPGTWKREKPRLDQILDALGGKRLRDLDLATWTLYLATKSTLAPRSRAMLEAVYRRILGYALEIGAVEFIHSFRRIRGASKRTLEITPLTYDEVIRLLDNAVSPVHRALFGLCAGMGLRPSEVTRVHWEDLDFKAGLIRVRGEKTEAADATIPLTPLANRDGACQQE